MSDLSDEQLRPCDCCHQHLTRGGPAFYRVLLEQHLADLGAINRLGGMVQMLGRATVLARTLVDEPLTKHASTGEVLLCQTCFLEADLSLGQLFDMAHCAKETEDD